MFDIVLFLLVVNAVWPTKNRRDLKISYPAKGVSWQLVMGEGYPRTREGMGAFDFAVTNSNQL